MCLRPYLPEGTGVLEPRCEQKLSAETKDLLLRISIRAEPLYIQVCKIAKKIKHGDQLCVSVSLGLRG
jgi:hypothetical protein